MEWLAVLGIFILWRWAASHHKELRAQLEDVENLAKARASQDEELIAQLTRRLHRVEQELAKQPLEVRAPVAVPETALEPPVVVTPIAESVPEPVALAAEPERVTEPVLEQVTAFVPVPEAEPVPAQPSWLDQFEGKDWEAIIGTSWLNALGVLVVVIGISLFLGYAVTQFGPLGKVTIGALASLALLAGGAFAERKETYVRLGRGLMAAGWASLYFTAYAAHGVPAARIIESPILGLVVLLAVACGMIGHSLRYRSQYATLTAYISAYLALQLTPASAVSLGASLPMALSLLTLSRTFAWEYAPPAAMVLTYLTFGARFGEANMTSVLGAGTLYAYWLSFEIHDLLNLRARRERPLVEMALYPLNAMLLLFIATLTLPPSSPIQSSNFLATAGFVFAISTAIRLRWEPAELPEARWSVRSLLARGHRITLALAAVFVAGSILRRFEATRSVIALMLEGQLLILIGLRLGDPFFRNVGALVMGAAPVVMAGRQSEQWRWLSIALAGQYYANRWLTRAIPLFTWGAMILLVPAIGDWLKQPWMSVAWTVFALVLHEVYRRIERREFLYQAVGLGLFAFLANFLSTLGASAADANKFAMASAAAAVLYYFLTWRMDRRFRDGASLCGAVLLALAIWQAAPAALVAPLWGLIALAKLELGFTWEWQWLRRQSYVLGLAAMGWLFTANFPIFSATGLFSHRILTVVPLIVMARHFWRRTDGSDDPLDAWAHGIYSWGGVIVAGALLRFELGRTLAVVGWAAMMLVLLHAALRRDDRNLLLQTYTMAALIFARAWATNFDSPEFILSLSGRVATGVTVIGAFFAGQARFPRAWTRSRMAFAIAGSALLGILLYYEVSGRVLTIAWAAEAVGLLMAGFAQRERILRLSGLSLFALCTGKLFFYDLRNLDTLWRIVAFIVMGLVMLGASSLYMRFEKLLGTEERKAEQI